MAQLTSGESTFRQDIVDLLAAFDDAVIVGDKNAFLSLWTDNGVWEIGTYNPEGSREIAPMRAQGAGELGKAFDGFASINTFFFRGTFAPAVRRAGEHAVLRVPTFELARRHDGTAYMNVAFYLDRLERHDGHWRFAARRYDYLWVDAHGHVAGAAIPLSEEAKAFLHFPSDEQGAPSGSVSDHASPS